MRYQSDIDTLRPLSKSYAYSVHVARLPRIRDKDAIDTLSIYHYRFVHMPSMYTLLCTGILLIRYGRVPSDISMLPICHK